MGGRGGGVGVGYNVRTEIIEGCAKWVKYRDFVPLKKKIWAKTPNEGHPAAFCLSLSRMDTRLMGQQKKKYAGIYRSELPVPFPLFFVR